jgi:RimJ/RimL family protein N-acetyltransferase
MADPATLFDLSTHFVRPLGEGDVPLIQDLSVRCADYSHLVTGQPPNPADARALLEDVPPEKTQDDNLVLGVFEKEAGRLVGVLATVRDYPELGTRYIGLLLLDPATRGVGLGGRLHRAFAGWARRQGVECLKLSVLDENASARRFWERLGYTVTRSLPARVFGDKTHTRVEMHLPLATRTGPSREDGELARHLDPEGRLLRYASRPQLKRRALEYLADKFEPGRTYQEGEVNALLERYHTFGDWALLRRDLFGWGSWRATATARRIGGRKRTVMMFVGRYMQQLSRSPASEPYVLWVMDTVKSGESAVCLESWGEYDLILLEELLGDSEMMAHLGGPESSEKIAERQARYEADERLADSGKSRMSKIADVTTGKGVGWVGYWQRTWRDALVYKIGWSVLPLFQGRGIAGMATAQAIEVARAGGRSASYMLSPQWITFPRMRVAASLALRF